MELDLRENGGVAILVLTGRLTAESAGQLREAVDTVLESGRPNLVLDFTEIAYIDSAGIGELVSSRRTVGRLGGALKILSPGKRVQDSLSLTRLLPLFEVFDGEAEAVASFGSAE